MDRAREQEIELACKKTLDRYAVAVGDQNLDVFVAQFAPDAIWQRPGTPALQGRPAIRAFMERPDLPKLVRHLNGSALIDVLDADHAVGVSYTSVFNGRSDHRGGVAVTQGPDYIVEYRDRFTRVGEDWLIARRDTAIIFASAQAVPLPGIAVPG